jgi:hypothetical protein
MKVVAQELLVLRTWIVRQSCTSGMKVVAQELLVLRTWLVRQSCTSASVEAYEACRKTPLADAAPPFRATSCCNL